MIDYSDGVNLKRMRWPDRFKIGLTLSGGAAYGIAHIGVLKAFEEYDISPQALYGTSAGSIVAVLYASGVDTEGMTNFAKETQFKKLVHPRWPSTGLATIERLKKKLEEYVPVKNLEDLPIRTMIGATNLEAGRHETLDHGSISDAVLASSAIPVFFQPAEFNGNLYVDGGVTNNMPGKPLRSDCNFVIGSDVVIIGKMKRKRIRGIRQLLDRSLSISLGHRTRCSYDECDFVLRIGEMARYSKMDFSKVDELIGIGYRQTLLQMPDMLEEIQNKIMVKEGWED